MFLVHILGIASTIRSQRRDCQPIKLLAAQPEDLDILELSHLHIFFNASHELRLQHCPNVSD